MLMFENTLADVGDLAALEPMLSRTRANGREESTPRALVQYLKVRYSLHQRLKVPYYIPTLYST